MKSPGPDEAERRLVAGLQPVREAIRARAGALDRVVLAKKVNPRLDALERFARDNGVGRVERAPVAMLDRACHGVSHQGAIAWAPPLELCPLEQILGRPALLAVALDGVQDPQNFGAVIRSAVAMGNAAILWGERGSAPLTSATFRASSGAVEHASLCRVRSLRGALMEAVSMGVSVVGLDPQSPQTLHETDLTGPTILVIGGEHAGLGRGVRRVTTALARVAKPGFVDSLNASVAAAVALYESTIQREKSVT